MPSDPKDIHALRGKAERLLAEAPEKLALMSGADLQKLLHELSVHQIELEMQNEELRTSQERLEQSRSEYADLYDFAPVGYLTFDEKAVITRANLTACSLLGIERSFLVMKPFAFFIHPDYQDLFYAHKQNALKATATETCQLVLKRKDGAFLDVQLESIPVQVNGQPALNSILTDITERKQFEKEHETAHWELEKKVEERTADLRAEIADRKRAESALRRAEKELRRERDKIRECMNMAGVMLMVLDREGRVALMNRKGYQILGYEEGELLGKDWITTCLPGRIRDELEPVFQKLISGDIEAVEYHENPVLTKLGEERIIAWHNAAMRDDAGSIIGTLSSGEDITERRKAQDALRESEARYRSLFENSFEAILLTSPGGRIWTANPEACRLFGWTEEELVRIGRNAIVDVADPRVALALRERESTGKAKAELTLKRKDESRFEGAVSFSIFETSNAELRTSMVIQDISERKLIEKRTQHLASFPQLTSDPIIEVASSGDVTFYNRAAQKVLEDHGMKGENFSPFIPTDLHGMMQELSQARTAPIHREVAIDGRVFDETIHFVPQFNTLRLYARDISERKRAEEALRESEERYRIAIESSNDGVAITRDGLHVYINRRFLEMFGYGEAEGVLAKPVGGFVHPKDRQRIVEMNTKRQAGEILSSKTEFVGIRSDGSPIHLEGSSSRITYGGEPASLSYLRDVSDRKLAEVQLRTSRERLRALAARLQAIREEERARVAREIHDELGQALTCMKIDLWQIREESSLDRVDKDAVLLKIESLLGFIDATVDTVRRVASDLRPSILDHLGLVPAIEWQLSEFQRRTGIICAFRKPRSLVIDKEYSTALFRVFQESLTNIARHSEAEKVEIALRKTKGELVLVLYDNGKGIRESDVSNGASLGVLGMRERLRPFGGHLLITGKPGMGTRVTVRIPLPGRAAKNRKGT